MQTIELTAHTKEMLIERNIPLEWVWQTINHFDDQQFLFDGTTHYFKTIAENGNRVLRVVVNETVDPHRVVTIFFDRRLRRKS